MRSTYCTHARRHKIHSEEKMFNDISCMTVSSPCFRKIDDWTCAFLAKKKKNCCTFRAFFYCPKLGRFPHLGRESFSTHPRVPNCYKKVEGFSYSCSAVPSTWCEWYHWRIQGGRQGRAPPLGVQILSFSCSFRQKCEK